MAKPTVIDANNFDKTLEESNLPVLVDFWAPWCVPCNAMAPILDDLAEEYTGKLNFTKLNVDDAPLIAPRYGIYSVPTLLVFKDGKPGDQIIGLKTKEELKKALEKALS